MLNYCEEPEILLQFPDILIITNGTLDWLVCHAVGEPVFPD